MGLNKKVLAFGATSILALGITGAAVGGHVSNSTANKSYASGGTATLAQMSRSAQGAATTVQTSAQAAAKRTPRSCGNSQVRPCAATPARRGDVST